MDIKVDDLSSALRFVARSNSQKPQQPELKCVLIEAEKDELTLTTTDLATTAHIKVPCKAANPFVTMVDFSALLTYTELARKNKDTVLHVDMRGKFKIWGSGAALTLPMVDANMFPRYHKPGKPDFYLSQNVLAAALSCRDFTSPDRNPLIYVNVRTGEAEGLDGYTGKIVEHNGTLPYSINISAKIIPGDRLEKIGVEKVGNTILLYPDSHAWMVSYQTTDGVFPDTTFGYTNQRLNSITLPKQELLQTLSILKIAGDMVSVTVDYDKVTMSVIGEKESEYTFTVPVGQYPNKFSMAITQFLSVLNDLEDNNITLDLGSPQEPIVVRENGRKYFMVGWSD
jgi:DNA polymerase III sliding clamp (beta) subunit (PCNA family)